MPYEDWDELHQAVLDAEDVLEVSMEDLRDLYGAGRLGVNVVDSISRELEQLGLGHFPDPLPSHRRYDVRIYRKGTPVADLIDAVLRPTDVGDETLRRAASSKSEEVLRRVRDLVCG